MESIKKLIAFYLRHNYGVFLPECMCVHDHWYVCTEVSECKCAQAHVITRMLAIYNLKYFNSNLKQCHGILMLEIILQYFHRGLGRWNKEMHYDPSKNMTVFQVDIWDKYKVLTCQQLYLCKLCISFQDRWFLDNVRTPHDVLLCVLWNIQGVYVLLTKRCGHTPGWLWDTTRTSGHRVEWWGWIRWCKKQIWGRWMKKI